MAKKKATGWQHKRLDQAVVNDADGNILYHTGAAEEFPDNVQKIIKDQGLHGYPYVDRVVMGDTAIIISPDGVLLSFYNLETGDMFSRKDIP